MIFISIQIDSKCSPVGPHGILKHSEIILADILNTFYESALMRTEKKGEESRLLLPDSLILRTKLKGTYALY